MRIKCHVINLSSPPTMSILRLFTASYNSFDLIDVVKCLGKYTMFHNYRTPQVIDVKL